MDKATSVSQNGPFVPSLCELARTYGESLEALLATRREIASTQETREAVEVDLKLCDNELDRLRAWAAEHSIHDGRLDYTLRNASHLRGQVQSLLQDLQELKNRSAKSGSISSSSMSDESSDGSFLSLAQSDDAANGATSSAILDRDTRPPAHTSQSASHRSGMQSMRSSIGIDPTAPSEASDPSTPSRRVIDKAHTIITMLLELGPSLQNPATHDDTSAFEARIIQEPDLQHVSDRHPRADKEIVRRFGLANWERRQSLARLRLGIDKVTEPKDDANNASLDNTLKVKDDQRNKTGIMQRKQSDLISFSARSSISRTVSSTVDTSNYSNLTSFQGTAQSTDPTTLSTGPEDQMDPVGDEMPLKSTRLLVPRPPRPNHRLVGKSFRCPYCLFTLDGISSEEKWEDHVFSDLRPYVCTQVECARPTATYADANSWWHHEINAHRLKRVWECGPCFNQDDSRTSFKSRDAFERHLHDTHPIISSRSQLRSIANMCERRTEVEKYSQSCPLCLEEIVSDAANSKVEHVSQEDVREQTVLEHIADHMRQLALFVALPIGQIPSEPDTELDLLDDSDDEVDHKVEIMSILSADDRGHLGLSKDQVRAANVQRFFNDQDPHMGNFNLSANENKQSMPARTNLNVIESSSAESPATSSSSSNELRSVTFPLNTVLYPRNRYYHGKEGDLQEIHSNLTTPGTICLLHGLSGVGKTHTAVEYSYEYRNYYDSIFWLQADTPPGLAESYSQMLVALGIAVGSDDDKRAMERGRDWLAYTERRWLLIFDNVHTWESIANCVPYEFTRSRGSILITTQNGDMRTSQGVPKTKELTILDPDDGGSMILKYLREENCTEGERDLAREISSFVGGLPIAIAHVAGYAEYSRWSLEELLEIFREWRRVAGISTDEADDLPATFRQAAFSYDDTLNMVWNVTSRELSNDALDLTYILAYLNCEAVPETMIWGMHTEPSLQFLNVRETFRAKNTKNALIRRRLVQYRTINKETCFYVHRSLQRSIRETLAKDPEKQQSTFDRAISLVSEVFPRASPVQHPQNLWSEFQRLLPHVHSLRDVYRASKNKIKGSVDFARILSDAGINQWDRGVTREGLLLLRTAEEVLDSISFDPNDTMRADIHIILGLMYDNTGISNRQEAIERREKALKIREAKATATRHDDEVLIYNARMDIAVAHLQFHNYAAAEVIVEDCFQKYKLWGTPEEIPFEHAKYYNKIAFVRLYQHRFHDAVKAAEEAVRLISTTSYPIINSRFQFDLANILLQAGNTEASQKLHQSLFDWRVSRLGQSSTLSLHSRYALGFICELKQQYADAEYWFQRALNLSRAASWSNEAISRTQFHLARVLRKMGSREDDAQNLHDEAMATLRRLLGDEPWNAVGLKPVEDEGVLFDHIMAITAARFAGKGLLDYAL